MQFTAWFELGPDDPSIIGEEFCEDFKSDTWENALAIALKTCPNGFVLETLSGHDE